MMVPAVARVSAPRITPFLNLTPTMVVPVDVCFGSLNPFCVNERFLFVNTRSRGQIDAFDNCRI
jgi:hypothetical protein